MLVAGLLTFTMVVLFIGCLMSLRRARSGSA